MAETAIASTPSSRPIVGWLLICCATIFAMVVLGGVTRLTGSGLSMVEWEPIMGVLPPMGDAEWQKVFELYKQYPEYRLKNFNMDVDGFKSIFWFEYAHRVLGRLIGVMFAVPLLYFVFRGRIGRPLIPKMVLLFVLGGLQGLMGWYMVMSGMVDDPHVSQYRLTAHLLLAIVVYGYMFWVAMDVLYEGSPPDGVWDPGSARLRNVALGICGFVLLTIGSGGFVAGLKAGFTYNTFPLMNGKLVPDGLMLMDPTWRNLFENITTVQFNHRLLAMGVFVAGLVFYLAAIRQVRVPRLRMGLHLLLAALVGQVSLGISTLLLVVPVTLAAAHQGGAVALLTATLYVTHQLHQSQMAAVAVEA